MAIWLFSLLIGFGSFVAGLLGALTGLGGGVVLIPMLVLAFGVDLHYAIGSSLVAVVATSSGAAAAYVRQGYTNVRLGIILELATTGGALLGAFLAFFLATSFLEVLFGLVLLASAAWTALHVPKERAYFPATGMARWLELEGSYPTASGPQRYSAQRFPGGFALMFLAGIVSSLLGIGSGALKVLAMDQVMRLPFKVSTATSNFMIGVTAAASAGVYLNQGYVDPGLTMPVMLGVLAGAYVGAQVLARLQTTWLRRLFILVITVLAVQMIAKGIAGEF
jgi:uncharacterized membrane protein YfcA